MDNKITNVLLTVIAILLVAILFLQANQISTQTPYVNSGSATVAMHSANNPVLRAEQQALYQAPALTEFNRGIHTWN